MPPGYAGSPEAALRGADVFIGLSGSTLAEEAIARMAPGAIAFLLSNPDPEIHPDVARRHVAVVATGRSDFPNQINNSLAFPGVFRAALDVRASTDHGAHEAGRRGRDRGPGRRATPTRTTSSRASSTSGSPRPSPPRSPPRPAPTESPGR